MMALRAIQPNKVYINKPFYDTATAIVTPLYEVVPDMKWANQAIFSRRPEWQELLMKQDRNKRSERKAFEDDLIVNKEIGTASVKEYNDSSIYECRIPTEFELHQAEIMNIPTQGFCVSADIEKITAESYRYLYDPDEFTPSKI